MFACANLCSLPQHYDGKIANSQRDLKVIRKFSSRGGGERT